MEKQLSTHYKQNTHLCNQVLYLCELFWRVFTLRRFEYLINFDSLAIFYVDNSIFLINDTPLNSLTTMDHRDRHWYESFPSSCIHRWDICI